MPARNTSSLLVAAILLFICTENYLIAGPPGTKENFQFPHFFSQSPDRSDEYVLRFSKGIMRFGESAVTFQLLKADRSEKRNQYELINQNSIQSETVRLRFLNANLCQPQGTEPLASKTNYLLGSESEKWKKDLRNYNSLFYRNIYPSVDLKYYVSNEEVKYDYFILPGGEVSSIRMLSETH